MFSQINPFSQYVIKDIQRETDPAPKPEDTAEAEAPLWNLHENLFKRPNHEVKPETLVKTSYQMFSVYKYYENPSLQVNSKYHNGNEEYVEVRDLVPKIKFFDAPVKPPAEPPKEAVVEAQ